MKILTVEQHKKRIENLKYADSTIKKYFRKQKIHDYIPGHVVYNLGSMPAKIICEPTEYDDTALKRIADSGFEWVQWHEDWRDPLRRWGGNMYASADPAGTQRFIDLAHSYNLKMIPYISPSYFPTDDPDFQPEFLGAKDAYVDPCYKYSACSLGSPQWREFNFRKTMEILDRHNFDGIYADFGYDKFLPQFHYELETYGHANNIMNSTLPYDAEAEDYLGMIYAELKSRGLLYKLHLGGFLAIPAKEKVYDYLWVGEADDNVLGVTRCKGYEPYIAPAFHWKEAKNPDYDAVYAATIPFVQFPVLYYGRPLGADDRFAGDDLVFYMPKPEVDDVREFYLAHPDGPYVYSEWSSLPDDPQEFDRATTYLALYKPMVTECSVVHMDIREAAFLRSEIPENVHVSMFTNEEQYLVVSNLTDAPYTLLLSELWTDRQSGEKSHSFTIPEKRILFLKK